MLAWQVQNKEKKVGQDSESLAFLQMVNKIRSRFNHDDSKTNPGYVLSSVIKSSYPKNTSIKLIVRFDRCLTVDNSVTFTCDVTTTIDHIIFKVLSDMKPYDSNVADEFLLQVSGINEYLNNSAQLQEYEFVHYCYKFDKDVEFILVRKSDLVQTLSRTAEDDVNDSNVKIDEITPQELTKKLLFEDLVSKFFRQINSNVVFFRFHEKSVKLLFTEHFDGKS